MVGSYLPEIAGSVVTCIDDEIDGCENGSSHKDDALNDIAPNDSLHTTHAAIENGNQCHERYTHIDIDAGDGGHCQ